MNRILKSLLFAFMFVFSILFFGVSNVAFATTATLSNLSDTLSTQAAGGSSTHTIKFTVHSASAITAISITASSAWGSTPATTGYTVKDGSTVETVSSVTSSTTLITINSSFTPAIGDVITIVTPAFTNQNPGVSTDYSETIDDGNETGVLGVLIIYNSANQVSLTASVGPSISFSVSPSSLTLPSGAGTFLANSTTTNVSNNLTLSISTNASNGAVVDVSDQSSGLYNSVANHTIASVTCGSSPTALNTSTENYGVGDDAGTTGIYSGYATAAVSSVGCLSTTPQLFWTVSAPTNTITSAVYFNALSVGTTPAGSYTDTVTFTATGQF